jgi:hypothetical protein
MLTFSDLIKNGVAPSRYEQPIAKETPTGDPFVRAYNNVWGVVSDTHMNKIDDDDYFITGTLVVNQRRWMQFLNAEHWGAYSFLNTAAARVNNAKTLSDFLTANGLEGYFDTINGDQVFYLRSKIEDNND